MNADRVYFATALEMEKLDELAVETGLEIRQMMELAGWQMIPLLRKLGMQNQQSVVVVCGKGNKGGDGLSSARHLFNHGFEVSVVLVSGDLKNDPAHHLKLLEKMKVNILNISDKKNGIEEVIHKADVIIDALIGYHLNGAPRGAFGEMIKLINKSGKQVIAYDLPTGVDATSGECYAPCIKAEATLSLALAKRAFDTKEGKKVSGKVYLADIGIPEVLYDQIAKGVRPEFEKYDDFLIPIM